MNFVDLYNGFLDARKSGNSLRKDTIGSIIDAINKMTITKDGRIEITDELVDKAILKEVKTLEEMVSTCPNDRADLITEYTSKLAIVREFAPKLISDEAEIRDIIDKIIMTNNLNTDFKNKGKITGIVMRELKGKADLKIVNQVIQRMYS